ncbi:MAG: hypothetical protein ABW101_02675 [Candidatus Thiodiazotropha sp.]
MSDPRIIEDKVKQDVEYQPRGNPLLIILAVVVGVVVFFGFTSLAQAQTESASEAANPVAEFQPPVAEKVVLPPMVTADKAREIAEKWGVELISLRLTAAGYMIDFRFKVLDVDKSKVFFSTQVKPQLVVEKSNAKLPVPMAAKVGAFRTTDRGRNIKPDRIYYIVFANPDAHVKSGETVTMVVGDFKEAHLVVN